MCCSRRTVNYIPIHPVCSAPLTCAKSGQENFMLHRVLCLAMLSRKKGSSDSPGISICWHCRVLHTSGLSLFSASTPLFCRKGEWNSEAVITCHTAVVVLPSNRNGTWTIMLCSKKHGTTIISWPVWYGGVLVRYVDGVSSKVLAGLSSRGRLLYLSILPWHDDETTWWVGAYSVGKSESFIKTHGGSHTWTVE